MVCASVIALAGCTWLPTAGPTKREVLSEGSGPVPPFDVVTVDDQVVHVLNSQTIPTFATVFGRDGRPPEPKINVGDGISIMIWEAGGNGLFSQSSMLGSLSGTNTLSSGSRPAEIPEQIVQRDGFISVPFSDRIQALGRTPVEVAADIRRHLLGKAVDPQVIVSVATSVGNTVTVQGEVQKAALIPLSPYGMHVLDVIAAAGGYHTPDFETYVKLSRRGSTVSIPLSMLINDPAQNIFVWPGDTLTLVALPRVFEAFGATAKDAEIPFNAENVSLAQALAKASGLLDERADPAGVFLIRYEQPAVVNAIDAHPIAENDNAPIPVVYHLDFSALHSYFLADRFPMHDKDIIYVADATSDTLLKFFNLLGTLTNPIVTGFVLKNSTQ